MSILKFFTKEQNLFCLHQFFHVGLFSYYIALLPLYLAQNGFRPVDIAYLSLCSTVSMMFSGFIIVEIVGKKLTASFAIKALALISNFLYLAFLSSGSVVQISTIWSFFIGTRISIGILIDTELVRQNSLSKLNFERIRVWGSIGFIFFGAVLGILFDNLGPDLTSKMLILVMVIQFFVNFSLADRIKSHSVVHLPLLNSLKVLFNKNILLLLLTIAFTWVSHGPLYTYLSLYLKRLSYTSNEISFAWNLGVVAEIIFFISLSKLNKFFSLINIFKWSVYLSVIRWLILVLLNQKYMIYFSQLLHAFSFAGVYICSTKLIFNFFPTNLNAKSQGYLSLFGIGMGSLIGRIILSLPILEIEDYLNVKYLFILSLISSLIASILCFNIDKPK